MVSSEKAYVCNDCGKIYYAYANQCPRCTRTDISLFTGPNGVIKAQELSKKLEKGKDAASNVEKSLYVSVFFVLIIIGGYYYLNKDKFQKAANSQKQVKINKANKTHKHRKH